MKLDIVPAEYNGVTIVDLFLEGYGSNNIGKHNGSNVYVSDETLERLLVAAISETCCVEHRSHIKRIGGTTFMQATGGFNTTFVQPVDVNKGFIRVEFRKKLSADDTEYFTSTVKKVFNVYAANMFEVIAENPATTTLNFIGNSFYQIANYVNDFAADLNNVHGIGITTPKAQAVFDIETTHQLQKKMLGKFGFNALSEMQFFKAVLIHFDISLTLFAFGNTK